MYTVGSLKIRPGKPSPSAAISLLLLTGFIFLPLLGCKADYAGKYGHYHESKAKIWVANINDNTVSVLDSATGETLKSIKVGDSPIAITSPPGGSSVYVTSHTGATVTVIDRASMEVVKTIPLGAMPYWVFASQDGSRIYVAIVGGSELKVIDTKTDSATGSIPVGKSPVIVSGVSGGLLLVANSGSNDISIIDTNGDKEIARIPVGKRPVDVQPSRDGRLAFVANSGSGDVSIIDLLRRTQVAAIRVGATPTGVVPLDNGKQFLVIDHTGGSLKVFDVATRSLIRELKAGKNPIGAAAMRGGPIFVANSGGDDISKIDPKTGELIATLKVGKSPRGILIEEEKKQDGYEWLASLRFEKMEADPPHSHAIKGSSEKSGMAVSGTVVYAGKKKGALRMVLHRNEPPAGPPIGYRTYPDAVFPFSFEIPVPRPGTYYIRAHLDADLEDGMFPKEDIDPQSVPESTEPAKVTESGSEPLRVTLLD